MTVEGADRCKLCGGAVREAFRIPAGKLAGHPIPDAPDDCSYVECVRCHFCFTRHLDGLDHAQVYDEAYWNQQDPDWYGRVSETMRLVVMAAAMLGGEPWTLRILDFGCGMGAFVQTGREKLDLQVWGNDIIEPRFGREFFLRSLPAGHFDVVVACEVLEHLASPLEVLGEVVRSLRPGGVLAFQTAYYDPRVCGRDWWYVGPGNGHVSLFSPAALDVLFSKLGGKSRLVWNGYAGLQAWRF
jgi:SAM-dependent methyltransferase